MSKSAEAFRTISEVAEVLETPAHVLRFWESRFSQIRPVKRAGGRRYYRPADVALLGGIRRLLHEDGLTIRGVQKILREKGVRHVAGLAGAEAGWSASEDEAADDRAAVAGPSFAERPDDTPSNDTHLVGPSSEAPAGAGWASGDLFGTPAAAPERGTGRSNVTALARATPEEGPPDRADPAPAAAAEAPMDLDVPTLPREIAAEATPFPAPGQADMPSAPSAAIASGAQPAVADTAEDMPAAALLRAMDAVRARSVRGELKTIHDRLAALRARLQQSG